MSVKLTSTLLLAAVMVTVVPLSAQIPSPPAATVPAVPFEPLPTLNASAILQPQYFQGTNFTVRNPVPTYSGSNRYTIDSDYGVFEADGNAMLMRRVAEINGIAALQAHVADERIHAGGRAGGAGSAQCRAGFDHQSRADDLQRAARHLGLSATRPGQAVQQHRRRQRRRRGKGTSRT